MLQTLEIQNYAIIDQLEINFSKDLNIITGETGAGKSIIMGALSLIMGQRADTSVLFTQDKKCFIEGTFDISKYGLASFFDEEELDYEAELIIRREISKSGKSRAFVNDTPVTLSVLKSLANHLIDLQQQFDTMDINNTSFQLKILDALAGNEDLLHEYQLLFDLYIKEKKELKELQENYQKAVAEMDYIQFQLNELNEVDVQKNEAAELENKIGQLNHSEEIKTKLNMANILLSEGENGILTQIGDLRHTLFQLESYSTAISSLTKRLDLLLEELQDITNSFEEISSQAEYDPVAVQETQERLDIIYRLQQKHQAFQEDGLLAIQDAFQTKLNSFTDLSSGIPVLERSIETRAKKLGTIADKLSKKRKKQAPRFEKEIKGLLEMLSMENARLKIDIQDDEQLNAQGKDLVEFLFSANKGSALQSIRKVASGGELSRLALCTKSIVAEVMDMPTLIFDEIDSGVSGDVALKMGQIMKRVASNHQVISITHSPQVAARANKHFWVYKKTDKKRTLTRVQELSGEDRITEIAKMLSGDPPSSAAILNAEELIHEK